MIVPGAINAGIIYSKPLVATLYTATGSTFGSLTQGGGLAAGFDGVNPQAYNTGPGYDGLAVNANSYIGKSFASAQPIAKIIVYGTTSYGFCHNAGETVVLDMYARNGTPANATDGTFLGTLSFTETMDASGKTVNASGGSYNHVWSVMRSTTGGGSRYHHISELEYYTWQ